jgi:hypothetical protein
MGGPTPLHDGQADARRQRQKGHSGLGHSGDARLGRFADDYYCCNLIEAGAD